jgi:zinc protease
VVWQRTEIDGIPAYWADGDGDMKAHLVFRVGTADEQLAASGITHLIEHLALFSLGRQPHTANGQVDATTTVFAVKGDPQEVVEFLTGVCQALRSLPFDRLPTENQVLRAEASSRPAALMESLLLWRYGAATYGVSSYEEFGVGRHTPDQISAWVQRWFTRDNAVLVFAGGPPPESLRLDLPAGERIPPPAPSSALPNTPAYFSEPQQNIVAVNTVVSRSVAAQAYAMLLGRRLQKKLRRELGISYSPAASYDVRDGDVAHVTAFADGLSENHAELVSAFVFHFRLTAEEAASGQEIAEIVNRLRTAKRDSPSGSAYGNALRELFGREPISDGDFEASLAAVNPEAVREAGAEAFHSALLMAPGRELPGARFHPAPWSSADVVDGQVLRSADAPIDTDRLIIGPAGISRVQSSSRRVTVRFPECEAMLAWPDGGRRLIGRDGFSLMIEPTLWAGGSFLAARLDEAIPADRIVPRPQRSFDRIPKPKTSRYQRVRARLMRD